MSPSLSEGALFLAIAPPVISTFVLIVFGMYLRGHSERFEGFIQRLIGSSFALSFIAAVVLGIQLQWSGSEHLDAELGSWFVIGHYEFELRFVADRLSVPIAAFSSALLFVIATFSRKYLHKEPGYVRFFLLLGLFGAGVLQMVYAGSLDFAFFGWELVGLSSTLLIAFFHERKAPVRHAIRAFIVYRICDVGLLSAAVLLHHSAQTSGAVVHGLAEIPWWSFARPEEHHVRMLVGLCIVWASMGKAAQFPLGGWLPRAMEGPTPSSAIFYGAISVHLGPYLLLRAAPLLAETAVVSGVVILVGTVTAISSTFIGRTQTDIKSSLAYAVMTQIGLIYVEIGLGYYRLALLHMIGHASLRCLQVLRSPGILQQKFSLEKQLGRALPSQGGRLERLLPLSIQRFLYRTALSRAHLDGWGHGLLVAGLRILRAFDRLESAWVSFLLREPTKKTRRESLPLRGEP